MPMTPERLAEIRQTYETWEYSDDDGSYVADMVPELLDHIDDLTRQLSDARRIAIDSGAFQGLRGTDYDFEEYDPHDGCMRWRDDSWRADPVGPVAWEQVQQQ